MADECLLAVLAHPDDEAYRPGGTLALLARRGVRVHVLTATRGQAGSCGDPPLCVRDELPAVRERELRCACAALGIEPPRLFDYEDGYLSEADPATIVTQILAVVRDLRPNVILTYGPDGVSGHPDHVAIGQFAAEAFRRADEVVALYTMAVPKSLADAMGMKQIRAVPDEAITLTVDVAAAWEAKMAAIRCHATQLSSSPIMSAPLERQRTFLGVESFILAETRGAQRTFLDDLMTGKTSYTQKGVQRDVRTRLRLLLRQQRLRGLRLQSALRSAIRLSRRTDRSNGSLSEGSAG